MPKQKDSYRITIHNPDGSYRAALENCGPLNITFTGQALTMTGYMVDILGKYEDTDEQSRGRRKIERLTGKRPDAMGQNHYFIRYKNGSDFRTESFLGVLFAFGKMVDRLGTYEDQKIPA